MSPSPGPSPEPEGDKVTRKVIFKDEKTSEVIKDVVHTDTERTILVSFVQYRENEVSDDNLIYVPLEYDNNTKSFSITFDKTLNLYIYKPHTLLPAEKSGEDAYWLKIALFNGSYIKSTYGVYSRYTEYNRNLDDDEQVSFNADSDASIEVFVNKAAEFKLTLPENWKPAFDIDEPIAKRIGLQYVRQPYGDTVTNSYPIYNDLYLEAGKEYILSFRDKELIAFPDDNKTTAKFMSYENNYFEPVSDSMLDCDVINLVTELGGDDFLQVRYIRGGTEATLVPQENIPSGDKITRKLVFKDAGTGFEVENYVWSDEERTFLCSFTQYKNNDAGNAEKEILIPVEYNSEDRSFSLTFDKNLDLYLYGNGSARSSVSPKDEISYSLHSKYKNPIETTYGLYTGYVAEEEQSENQLKLNIPEDDSSPIEVSLRRTNEFRFSTNEWLKNDVDAVLSSIIVYDYSNELNNVTNQRDNFIRLEREKEYILSTYTTAYRGASTLTKGKYLLVFSNRLTVKFLAQLESEDVKNTYLEPGESIDFVFNKTVRRGIAFRDNSYSNITISGVSQKMLPSNVVVAIVNGDYEVTQSNINEDDYVLPYINTKYPTLMYFFEFDQTKPLFISGRLKKTLCRNSGVLEYADNVLGYNFLAREEKDIVYVYGASAYEGDYNYLRELDISTEVTFSNVILDKSGELFVIMESDFTFGDTAPTHKLQSVVFINDNEIGTIAGGFYQNSSVKEENYTTDINLLEPGETYRFVTGLNKFSTNTKKQAWLQVFRSEDGSLPGGIKAADATYSFDSHVKISESEYPSYIFGSEATTYVTVSNKNNS